mgnify:CR=1 FL=1
MTNRSDDDVLDSAAVASEASPASDARKRPKPGERRVQILQMLASMLEQPGAERITTAFTSGCSKRSRSIASASSKLFGFAPSRTTRYVVGPVTVRGPTWDAAWAAGPTL